MNRTKKKDRKGVGEGEKTNRPIERERDGEILESDGEEECTTGIEIMWEIVIDLLKLL